MKIFLVSLGCSKNLIDSEILLNQIKENGYKIAKNAETADTLIINTCGFIEDSKKESLYEIFEAIELKKKNVIKKLIIMGCLSERYKYELKKELPEVDGVFGVNELNNIIKFLGGSLKNKLIDERYLLTPKHYAFLKISEGCDRPCSFCAIPKIRGSYKSKTIKNILLESELLAKQGVKEVILIAQDLTNYGLDLYNKKQLGKLLRQLASENYFDWIRLMYAYPSNFPMDVLEVMATEKSICKYLDIPIQHISDTVLKSMRRGYTTKQLMDLLIQIRKQIPGIALRTSLIVGYPNESEDDFEQLVQFVKDFKFDRLGVFTYSHEEDTYAYVLEDLVDRKIKRQRYNKLMNVQKKISEQKNQRMIGKEYKVLVDEISNGIAFGRTEFDAPEIDNEVIISKGKKLKVGEFSNIIITDATEYELYGKLK